LQQNKKKAKAEGKNCHAKTVGTHTRLFFIFHFSPFNMAETRDWSAFIGERLSEPWRADRAGAALMPEHLQQIASKWLTIASPIKLRLLLAVVAARRQVFNKESQISILKQFRSLPILIIDQQPGRASSESRGTRHRPSRPPLENL
jgi:hypothetical protein